MKRVATGGLILAIVVLTGLGVAGSLIRLKPCRTCAGLVQFMRKTPSKEPPTVGCPDCGDRRKLSLFRSWMPSRVSPSIVTLLDGLQRADALAALQSMARASGPEYADFLYSAIPSFHYFEGAGFLEAQGKTYVALFSYSGFIVRESDGVTVILLSAEGRALDFIQLTWMTSMGPLSPSVEGAEVVLRDSETYSPEVLGSYRLSQWKSAPRQGNATRGMVCRFIVRNDRLEAVGNR